MFQRRKGLIIKMEFNATHCGTPRSTSIGTDVQFVHSSRLFQGT